jgi:hypothetical protein
MESSQRAHDDLSVIRGIGPARQRWLRDSFNARTYQDVARLSVDRIESRLKADGQIVSRGAIEAWLVQARELGGAGTGRHSRSGQNPGVDPASTTDNPATTEDGWEPFASFVVEFQARGAEGQAQELRTAIHHMESDTDTYWPGIETSQVCQWMVDQLPASVQERGQESHREQAQPVKTPVAEKVKITQVRVFQPPENSLSPQRIEAGGTFQGAVRGGQPFTLEVDFELDVAAAAGKTKGPIECSARSYAYDLAQQASISLGDTELIALDKGQSAYTLTLPQATLQCGKYRLWVLVTPQEARFVLPDYVEVPMFQVV